MTEIIVPQVQSPEIKTWEWAGIGQGGGRAAQRDGAGHRRVPCARETLRYLTSVQKTGQHQNETFTESLRFL